MRSEIAGAQRLVVKVGSSSLTTPSGGFDHNRVHEIAAQLSALHAQGKLFGLVTSGAIAAALSPLGLDRRPRDLETQQAAAAVGQGLLIRHYTEAFATHGVKVAQILLTVDDLLSKKTYRNALNTISRLLRLGVVPIINENDTTTTHEIRFGDNDRLAALVAHLMRADALMLFTDVAGLYTAHPESPGAELIPLVENVDELQADTSRVGSRVGTGGMRTKVAAAAMAAHAGISTVLAHADDLGPVLAGEELGTLFRPVAKRRPRRLLWLAHVAEPAGRLSIDAGAVRALHSKRASLLAVGVTGVTGSFESGDPVAILGPDGVEIGRGLVGYSSRELAEVLAQAEVESGLDPVVHRDLLVLD